MDLIISWTCTRNVLQQVYIYRNLNQFPNVNFKSLLKEIHGKNFFLWQKKKTFQSRYTPSRVYQFYIYFKRGVYSLGVVSNEQMINSRHDC